MAFHLDGVTNKIHEADIFKLKLFPLPGNDKTNSNLLRRSRSRKVSVILLRESVMLKTTWESTPKRLGTMEYNVTSNVLWNITNLTTSTTANSHFGDELSSSNDSEEILNCTNEYCISNEDYTDRMWSHVFPTTFEWFFIFMHSLVFIVGLVGNALVCLAVYRNHSMRTVTNYFIVNLAVADFMVILICLPPTVLWDVTETWFMGTILCKVVLYLQVRNIYLECNNIFIILGNVPRSECWMWSKHLSIGPLLAAQMRLTIHEWIQEADVA